MNRFIPLAVCSALSLPASGASRPPDLAKLQRDLERLGRDQGTLFAQVVPALPKLPDGGFPHPSAMDDEDDEDDDDQGAAPGRMGDHLREQMKRDRERRGENGGPRTATLAVKGPVLFRLRSQSGDVEVVVTDKAQIVATLEGGAGQGVALKPDGDRVEADFGGSRQLRHGHLRLELPKGSSLDFVSLSGDLTVEKLGGDVRARTMSGDVKVSGVASADVQTISGDAVVESAGGAVRVHTVSGHGTISTTAAAPDVEFQSASGGLAWSGACAKGCHLTSETVSGDVRLQPDPKSSFLLSFASHSGDLQDDVSMTVKRAPRKKHGMGGGWLEAAYGAGDGRVECNSFSGSLQVKKR